MIRSLCIASTVGLALLLGSCLWKEPVFTEDFSKVDEGLEGVWFSKDGDDDPRDGSFAICMRIDEDRYLLHHPAREDDGIYYEARPLKRQGRTLLQLRILGTFEDGGVKPETARFVLLWVQPQADGSMVVRLPDGEDDLEKMTPAEFRKRLEDPAHDWEKFFGEGTAYRRISPRPE
ncbi:MAG: hypothetical protein HKO57_10145 [Akkermansiaceae bacterium]|nr:hypothetical protein [Akkermansiaceae bacterium]